MTCLEYDEPFHTPGTLSSKLLSTKLFWTALFTKGRRPLSLVSVKIFFRFLPKSNHIDIRTAKFLKKIMNSDL